MNFLKKDVKEEAKIRRKQLMEEKRKPRIFDSKRRLFGVDTDAWVQQIGEKRKEDELAQRREELYSQRKMEEERLVLKKAREEAQLRRQIEQDLVTFREMHQAAETRREFDMNDPHAAKKQDVSLTAPRFEGEDGSYKTRLGRQKEESKAWLLQQIQEKQMQTNDEQDADRRMVNAQLNRDRRACQIAQLEEQWRRKLDLSIAEYNRLLADDQAAKSREEAQKETRTEAEEIHNWVAGDWLTENPKAAYSAFGPHRVIPYMYKGQTYDDLIKNKQEQLAQKQNKKMDHDAQQAFDRRWHDYLKSSADQATKTHQQYMQDQRELDKRNLELNSKLADEQKTREAVNNDLSQLKPTEKFFDQFNRTTY